MFLNFRREWQKLHCLPRRPSFLRVGGGLLAGFLILLFAEVWGLLSQFDPLISRLFQSWLSSNWDILLSLLSLLGSLEVTTLFLGLIVAVIFRYRERAYAALGFFAMIMVFELIGKLFLYHPGPPVDYFRYSLPFSFPTAYIHTDFSFPSGHMARTVYLAVLIGGLAKNFAINRFQRRFFLILLVGLIVLVTLMFYSRVYLGEHWFSDVVGGLLLGSAFAFLALAY